MLERRRAAAGARAIGRAEFCGVPSAGLLPHQIDGDEHLLRELILRASIEYLCAQCCANDRALPLDRMAEQYGFLLTCEASDPPVRLADLLAEVRQRARAGSPLAARFVQEYDRRRLARRMADAPIELIMHGLIFGDESTRASAFVRCFRGLHAFGSVEEFAAQRACEQVTA
jgi:hypothetical protein